MQHLGDLAIRLCSGPSQQKNPAVEDHERLKAARTWYLSDKRLSAALQNAATGEVGLNITQATEHALKEGRSVRGLEQSHRTIKCSWTN